MLRNTIIVLVFLMILIEGCSEIDIAVVVDQEEIMRYVNESDVGLELFPNTNLINNAPYELAFDSGAVFRDVVDSVKRSITVDITTNRLENNFMNYYENIGVDTFVTFMQDFGSPYFLSNDAEVTVEDKYYISTTRSMDGGTDTSHHTRTVKQYGYFLKLGGDGQAFRGWLLIGYSGIVSSYLSNYSVTTVEEEDHTTFSGYDSRYQVIPYLIVNVSTTVWDTLTSSDGYPEESSRPYIKLSGPTGIETVNKGDSLYVTVTADSTICGVVISYETDSGYVKTNMVRDGTTQYVYSLKTPDNNDKVWNVLFFQAYVTGTTTDTLIGDLYYKSWFVPFQVN